MMQFETIATALLAAWVVYTLYSYVVDPLRNVPGPFAARFTRFWELAAVRRGHFEQTDIKLHEQLGPIVRIAPGKYSISDPSAVKSIYGHGTTFKKSSFYHAFGNPDASKADMFSERNNDQHAMKRRKVASLYSMTTLLSYEDFVNKANKELCDSLLVFSKNKRAIPIPNWMQYYAFDVIGEITVGESFGFMEHGKDHNGILGAIHDSMTYGSRMGLFPELHPILGKMTQLFHIPIPFDIVMAFITKAVSARRNGAQSSDRKDFLDKLLQLREQGKIEDNDIHITMGANVAAGSDTTALSLSSIIYHLTQNPQVVRKLREEIDTFAADGKISDPVTYKESQTMPYLQAVIKEALRVHPATGQPLMRIVPSGGAEIAGRFFPEGAEVGINSWVLHYNKEVFGADAADFRPERWLGDKEKVQVMDQSFLAFGAGARTCIGKNISLLEMGKVVPQLYRKFDFELVDGPGSYATNSVWFVKQKFACTVKAR